MEGNRARSVRGIGLLLIGMLTGMLLISPASGHFTQNTRHLGQHAWDQVIKKKVFTKQQANRRFARRMIEPYREVGAQGQPAFQNGWGNLGGGFGGAGYSKDSQNIVHLKGAVAGGTNGTTAFTLPEGYRPPQNLFMPMVGSTGLGPQAAGLVIHTDGRVVLTCATATCSGGIDGLSFRVEP